MRPVPPGLAWLLILLGGLMLVIRLMGLVGDGAGVREIVGVALAAVLVLTGVASLVAWRRARRAESPESQDHDPHP